jgi:DNA-binding NtrC family response regulator
VEAFTGAVNDQLGLVKNRRGRDVVPRRKSATSPIDVQPKLLRFPRAERDSCRLARTRPQRVDVRVIAATNADLEQRVGDENSGRPLLPADGYPPHSSRRFASAAK